MRTVYLIGGPSELSGRVIDLSGIRTADTDRGYFTASARDLDGLTVRTWVYHKINDIALLVDEREEVIK